MSENSPRWPGSNGSPGLDFSPYSKAATAEADRTAHADASARMTQGAQERAARTAQEWAATPSVPPVKVPDAPITEPAQASGTEHTGVLGKIRATTVEAANRQGRRTRKARLRLTRVDPWSVMKTTFLFAIAFGVMLVVAVFVLWSVLAGSGALDSANTLINTLIGDSDSSFRIEDYLSVTRVLGFASLIAAVDVVIITAVATLFAFLYNLSAVVMGGLEVTLAED